MQQNLDSKKGASRDLHGLWRKEKIEFKFEKDQNR
jgi:hypothetical protein